MAKRLAAIYRINADEAIQVSVPLTTNTPEGLYLAKTIAVAGVSEILADTIRQEREELARAQQDAAG